MAFTDFKDGVSFSSLSATPASFTLLGGRYLMTVAATWGGGSVDLQELMPDGSTLVSVLTTTFTANGAKLVDLPPGTYEVVITTATAVQGTLVRVPYRAA